MVSAISMFINEAGWLAPLYYVGSFLISALVPVIPTPLIGALGGTAFGFVPAVLYGIVGMALGAFTALMIARMIGRHVIQRLVRPQTWDEIEAFLGVRSVTVWGIIFFLFNLDFVVMASGLTSLPVRQLWLAAMIARLPWLVASAWFGDVILVSDTVMWIMLLLFVPFFYAVRKVQPRIRAWLVRISGIER